MNDYKEIKNQLDQKFKEEMNQCVDKFAEQVRIEFDKARWESLWTQIKGTLKNVNGYSPLFRENGDIEIYKTSGHKPCVLGSEKIVYLPVVEDERYILFNSMKKVIELVETSRNPFKDDRVTEISDHLYYTSEGYQSLFDSYL